MHLKKLTTILIVDRIETCLPTWQALGYAVQLRVPPEPAQGDAAFVILQAKSGELMLQTRASLQEDCSAVAKLAPNYLLYADVASLTKAKQALQGVKLLVEERETFYGAKEAWLLLADGTVLGLSEHNR